MKLAAIHVQQATPVSCVAACVCMVRRRRGESVEKRMILDEWSSGGPFSLQEHGRLLVDADYDFPGTIDPTVRSSRGLLRSVLRAGQWVLISIMPLPHPSPLHAVILIKLSEDDQFLYLDPGQPVQMQPLAFSEDELVEQWTGELIICQSFD